jgi:serine/threonine protein phosphatase PrpC
MSDEREADTVELEVPLASPDQHGPRPHSSQVRFEFGARSHPGKVRPRNEDHFIVTRYTRSMQPLMTNLPDGLIPERYEETAYCMLVADGMGGMAAGQLASRLAIAIGVNLSLDNPKWILKITGPGAQELMDTIRQRFRTIDESLTERARADATLTGMGTTLTAALSVGADLFLFHVGDSRVYLFRGGDLLRLTRDHTLAQAMADAGSIPPEDVSTHRYRHVLTKFIGGHGGKIEAEVQHFRLTDGDRLLLCTDGLTEMVEDGEIAAVLRRMDEPDETCQALVDRALEEGGKDNVTVVLARYAIPEPSAEGPSG